MSEFFSRSATPEDTVAIVALTDEAVAVRNSRPIPLIDLEDIDQVEDVLCQPTTWSRVALQGEKIVGHVIGYPAPEAKADNPYAVQHLAWLMVHPDHWREGVGSNLLDWALQTLPDNGAESVYLWADTTNQPAHKLYLSRGLQANGESRLHPTTNEPQIKFTLAF